MYGFYPAVKAYVRHSLSINPLHTLNVEEYGNPEGLPVLFVHGGPGAGCEAYHARLFDPSAYRIILFDQRGCGRSTPHGELKDNHTQALVADMEAIRIYLRIDSWVLCGGSWGSTLSLVYAQAYPERVKGLVLRGIFLCRTQDISWFYQSGANQFYPDYWQDFVRPISAGERDNMIRAYYKRLTGKDEIARMTAAKAWSGWEARLATLSPNEEVVNHFSDPFTALALARIECHYFCNGAFLEPNQILRNANRLENIPGIIIHGRYDMVCPLDNAWQLHQAWPQAEYHVIENAGHSALEPGILDALIQATRELFKRLS